MATSVPRFWPPGNGSWWPIRPGPPWWILLCLGAVLVGSCSLDRAAEGALATTTPPATPGLATMPVATPASTTPEPTTPASTTQPAVSDDATTPERPAWLGRRTLPTDVAGVAVPQTTPEELRDRRLATVDTLPPPVERTFAASAAPLGPEVLERSTWTEGCPVEPADLVHLTLTFWGFDGQPHTGEMIVAQRVATDVTSVFEILYHNRFPIEEMRVVTDEDLVAPPTGDGNNTTGFVCRPVTGGTRFSQHAYGLAVDINPFHNPYRRGGLVLPELASHYLDRASGRPGVIVEGDVVVDAFDGIGWHWGGRWQTLQDYQHFSLNDR